MRISWFAMVILGAAACATEPSTSPGQAASAWLNGVKFTAMGQGSGAFSATLEGAANAAAPYTIRVHITKGGRIMPHTHPDTRMITVVDGELCYGFGAEFDENACKIYPEGSYFLVPGNAPHFGFGKTSEAVYQESGMGPSAFVPVSRPAQ